MWDLSVCFFLFGNRTEEFCSTTSRGWSERWCISFYVSEMVGKDNLKTEDLNLCFEKLMMLGGSGFGKGGVKMEGGVINEWKDIPMELLLQILSLVDDQTVFVAFGVCRGWRDAIFLGLTHLSLIWYIFVLLTLTISNLKVFVIISFSLGFICHV